MMTKALSHARGHNRPMPLSSPCSNQASFKLGSKSALHLAITYGRGKCCGHACRLPSISFDTSFRCNNACLQSTLNVSNTLQLAFSSVCQHSTEHCQDPPGSAAFVNASKRSVVRQRWQLKTIPGSF